MEYKSIYDMLVQLSEETNNIKFDLPNKKIMLRGKSIAYYDKTTKQVVINKDYVSLPLLHDVLCDSSWQEKIEELYSEFRVSVPSTHEVKSPFKSLLADNLTYEQMIYSQPRNVARVKLEAFIVLGVLSGLITWEDTSKYYWHSNNQPKLYMYRNWVLLDETNFKLH